MNWVLTSAYPLPTRPPRLSGSNGGQVLQASGSERLRLGERAEKPEPVNASYSLAIDGLIKAL